MRFVARLLALLVAVGAMGGSAFAQPAPPDEPQTGGDEPPAPPPAPSPPPPSPPVEPLPEDDRVPMHAPEDGDPLLDEVRPRYPACVGVTDDDRLEAAKGLHRAATRAFEQQRYAEARRRWLQAYAFDCTAHRLLLNIAQTYAREREDEQAWEARALYIERLGEEKDPIMAERVSRERPTPPYAPPGMQSAFAARTFLWPGGGDGAVWGWLLTGRARVDDMLLSLELPFGAWFSGTAVADRWGAQIDDARFGFGNPIVEVDYLVDWYGGGWRVGSRIGLPLASVDDVDWQRTVARLGESMAWGDLERWSPGALPIGVTTGLESRLVGPLFAFLDAQAILYVTVGRGDGPGADQDVFASIAGRGGFELSFPLSFFDFVGAGAAAQGVFLPRVDGDRGQVAADLFASYRGADLWLRAGTLWALDPPLGFAFDDGVATIYAEVGVPLE